MPKTCERTCRTCKHAGADPDGPYCAHPQVLDKHPYGRALHDVPGVPGFCSLSDQPKLKLWEEDPEHRFSDDGPLARYAKG